MGGGGQVRANLKACKVKLSDQVSLEAMPDGDEERY